MRSYAPSALIRILVQPLRSRTHTDFALRTPPLRALRPMTKAGWGITCPNLKIVSLEVQRSCLGGISVRAAKDCGALSHLRHELRGATKWADFTSSQGTRIQSSESPTATDSF